MAGPGRARSLRNAACVAAASLLFLAFKLAEAQYQLQSYDVARTTYGPATATFYGGNNAEGTSGGFCGYENPFTRGYGVYTAAISDSLLANGLNCGACFEVMCDWDSSDYTTQYCYRGQSTVITATNLSPPGLNGEHHFDLTYPMFTKIANMIAGRIPVQYRRVSCVKQGGIRFTIVGNPQWNLVLVYNMAGDGNVYGLNMKGSSSDWCWMNRNWGENWQSSAVLIRQALSFKVTTGSGMTKIFYNVADSNWQHGQTYEADSNF
ncbi:hypothetical protein R1flu_006393 [Riccia fluitans]|uniref:Expansin n=1 Tax=Riccia fluitans TaxID=41844 RepID=A0ABD1YYN3_9MARC